MSTYGYNALFFIAITLVFYFFILRPKSREESQRQRLLDELRVGTRVYTVGGIYGKVVSVQNKVVVLEVDKRGFTITLDRAGIKSVLSTDFRLYSGNSSGNRKPRTEEKQKVGLKTEGLKTEDPKVAG